MAQVTWRASEELVERVQGAARRQGRSMNDYITAVLDVAADANLAGTEAERLRKRLAHAGLLAPGDGRRIQRPSAQEVAQARAAAGKGASLSDLVSKGR
jgi:hypothetical protein